MEIKMPSAMIILKNTPRGFKLMPAAEINKTHFKSLMRSHEMSLRVSEVMDFAMDTFRNQIGHRTDGKVALVDIYNAMIKKYGTGWFDDVKYLPKQGTIPARLLVVQK